MNIKCPNCGNQGSTHFGSDAFEVRGTWEGKPVRKCLRCGAGVTVGFPKRIKLIEPGLWAQMEGSWAREFGATAATEDDDLHEQSAEADDERYPIVRCPYCGNTGSSAPGSPAFEFRVALGDPGARMCRRCERGFWMHSQTGETEPMGDEAWAGIEAMHATLGGGARVDAEWARREAARDYPSDDEQEAEDDEPSVAVEDEEGDEPWNVIPVDGREPAVLRGKVPEVTVTLLEVQDPARASEDIEPDEGMRYVAVRLRIANTGSEDYDETPSMGARLIDALGAEHEALIGWVEPDLDDLGTLAPGETADGFLTFEVPENMRPTAFRFAFTYAKTPPDAAEWKL